MTVTRDGATIRLQGRCRVEDAEPLASLLHATPGLTVDLGDCEGLHAAVVQALLAFAPKVVGTPSDPVLRDLILPLLAGERQRGQRPI
ncbi:hypothetical protein [Plastoroseomonas hellenica]|uniref:hypothetical protein n=1 Tax=Plastoroseomonas hellenica TaxID=2687306 RepID=UPI001BAB88C5|nr:hypothetical protein [Plastoroseomonas hellenica]